MSEKFHAQATSVLPPHRTPSLTAHAVNWSTMFVVAGIAMDIVGFAWAILLNRT